LYGCKNWFLILREEHRLKISENRMLRKICGMKRDKIIGGWSKLHNAELHNLYSSPNIFKIVKPRRMKLAEHVARMGEKRSAYRILVRKPEGKRPLASPRHRQEDNIKTNLGD
jgi:hypothetical protein